MWKKLRVGNVTLVNIGRRYEQGAEEQYGKDLALLTDVVRQGCKCARRAVDAPPVVPRGGVGRRCCRSISACEGGKEGGSVNSLCCASHPPSPYPRLPTPTHSYQHPPRGCIMLDTLPGHFPTVSGDIFGERRRAPPYWEPRDMLNPLRKDYICVPNEGENGGWRNGILSAAAAKGKVPVLRLAPFLETRFDAHQGFAGFGGTKRGHLDCVHWCYSAALWRPALARVHQAVEGAAGCLSEVCGRRNHFFHFSFLSLCFSLCGG